MTVKDMYDALQTLESSRDKDVEALIECFESLKLDSDMYDLTKSKTLESSLTNSSGRLTT